MQERELINLMKILGNYIRSLEKNVAYLEEIIRVQRGKQWK